MPHSCHIRPRAVVLLSHARSDGATPRAHKACLPSVIRSYQTLPDNKRRCISQKRYTHSKRLVSTTTRAAENQYLPAPTTRMRSTTPLSCLPWINLLRSYMITSISSVPVILKPSLKVLEILAHSKSRFLNPDHNRILHALLKRTFYVQFCAGETPDETRRTIKSLKELGYKGVILGHAREVVLSKEEQSSLDSSVENAEQIESDLREIRSWRDNTLATIMLTEKDDFAALKFTGSGRQALQSLKATVPCAPALKEAVHEMCQLAEKRGVSLLFDAEQDSLQSGIDAWTLYFMKHYNKDKAVVYGTYQAYMKKMPRVLAQHLAEAQKGNFFLGVKLVRGAYINSDPRELFWDTIEDTHKCYDNLAQCVLERKYSGMLQPIEAEVKQFPQVGLVLASHNAESVRKARTIREQQAQLGRPKIRLAYGQLMGMADHLSCELIQQANTSHMAPIKSDVEVPTAVKYLVWGTMGECMKYLLRRAHENKDAVSRTADARRALGKEIAIRLGLARA